MVSLKISVLVIACTLVASSAANSFELHVRAPVPCKSGTHKDGNSCVANDSNDHCGFKDATCTDPANGSSDCTQVGKSKNYTCDVTCDKGYYQKGALCARNSVPAHCGNNDTTCAAPANGDATCVKSGPKNFKCSFTCDPGFSKSGDTCDANNSADNCGSDGACDDPDHGTATCVGNVKKGFSCSAKCDKGYSLEDGDCSANFNTVNKCGPTSDVCPRPYQGHGSAICDNGDCDVKCAEGFKKKVIGGVVYCK